MKWCMVNINTIDEQIYNKYFSLMTPKRKEYISSLKNEKDRRLSLAGEILAKEMLAELYAVDLDDIVIEKDLKGRPTTNFADINISISHSGEISVCAVDSSPIGIDIEKIRRVNLKSAQRFCNLKELMYIESAETDEQKNFRFFEIWTSKEAEFKRLCTKVKSFKEIDTFNINKKYINDNGYLICISGKDINNEKN